MSRFRMDTRKVPWRMELLRRWKKDLEVHRESVKEIEKELRREEMTGVCCSLKDLDRRLQEEAQDAEKLLQALEEAAARYTELEERLKVPKTGEENPAYDEDGRYGGSQTAPLAVFLEEKDETYQELCEIIRSHYPQYSDRQMEKLVRDLELEGCGYVALANTLFGQYVGREEQFAEIFGFPMYSSSGELNTDLLVMDLYCSEDDPEKTGTTREEREEIWETYLKKHGVPVDVRTVEVTADSYEELSWEGELIVGISPCVLFDSGGNKVLEAEGGHAVTVTGVTEDGMFRVSSWGMEYYIRPEDPVYERIQFQQVCYGQPSPDREKREGELTER